MEFAPLFPYPHALQEQPRTSVRRGILLTPTQYKDRSGQEEPFPIDLLLVDLCLSIYCLSQVTALFQSTNDPCGLSRQAQT
jgi:hypothetical protein